VVSNVPFRLDVEAAKAGDATPAGLRSEDIARLPLILSTLADQVGACCGRCTIGCGAVLGR
jgi:hypothetical protein